MWFAGFTQPVALLQSKMYNLAWYKWHFPRCTQSKSKRSFVRDSLLKSTILLIPRCLDFNYVVWFHLIKCLIYWVWAYIIRFLCEGKPSFSMAQVRVVSL